MTVIALGVALTNVCALVSVPPAPTLIVTSSPVTSVISRNLPAAGSVDLGYVWLVALPSKAQVNVSELSSSLMKSPSSRLCP